MQVLGNCKGIIATAVSVLLFRNPVSAKGMFGYAITIVGVFLYSETKRRLKASPAKLALASSTGGIISSDVDKSPLTGMKPDVEAGEPLLKVARGSSLSESVRNHTHSDGGMRDQG